MVKVLYFARLREALEQGGFDVLHLACHGTFGTSADRSSVLLEDGEFSVAMLPHLSAEFRRASPLIFFNACHSGRLGFTLLGPGSWGAELIRLGCGAFVGRSVRASRSSRHDARGRRRAGASSEA